MNMSFERTKTVTALQLKLEDEKSYFLRLIEPMYVGKDLGKADADGAKQKPATLAKIVDLTDNEEKVIIVGSVLASTLSESYPDNKYVGVNLEVIVHAKANGKRYKTCSLFEVAVKEAPATDGATPAKKK